jgi:hypothetical protein
LTGSGYSLNGDPTRVPVAVTQDNLLLKYLRMDNKNENTSENMPFHCDPKVLTRFPKTFQNNFSVTIDCFQEKD